MFPNPTPSTPPIACEEILKIIKGDKIKEEDLLKIALSIGRKISPAISRDAFQQ